MATKAQEVKDTNQEQDKDFTMNTTKVKVKFTNIKYFDNETNEVKELRVMGKVSVPECKETLKKENAKNVYISRTLEDESFEVSTVALYALKETV